MKKNLKNFFVPNELKSPKNNMSFLFYPYLGVGWVGQTQILIYPYFFVFLLNPSLSNDGHQHLLGMVSIEKKHIKVKAAHLQGVPE